MAGDQQAVRQCGRGVPRLSACDPTAILVLAPPSVTVKSIPHFQNKNISLIMSDENMPPVDSTDGVQEGERVEKSSKSPRSSTGWDGKLRVGSAVLTNPEAISDPEYSDEENVLAGEKIDADEGMSP